MSTKILIFILPWYFTIYVGIDEKCFFYVIELITEYFLHLMKQAMNALLVMDRYWKEG